MHEIEIEDMTAVNGKIYNILVEFTAGYFIPAQTSGPVESCYPAEGDAPKITAIYLMEEYDEGEDMFVEIEKREVDESFFTDSSREYIAATVDEEDARIEQESADDWCEYEGCEEFWEE